MVNKIISLIINYLLFITNLLFILDGPFEHQKFRLHLAWNFVFDNQKQNLKKNQDLILENSKNNSNFYVTKHSKLPII